MDDGSKIYGTLGLFCTHKPLLLMCGGMAFYGLGAYFSRGTRLFKCSQLGARQSMKRVGRFIAITHSSTKAIREEASCKKNIGEASLTNNRMVAKSLKNRASGVGSNGWGQSGRSLGVRKYPWLCPRAARTRAKRAF